MDAQKLKHKRALRRQYRVRNTLYGTPERPRLSVFRSNLHIYAQLIDDVNGVTLAAASTVGKNNPIGYGGNKKAAEAVGQAIAEKAKALGITQAQFDRGHYRFHGRIAALALAATKAGLVCTGLEERKKKLAASDGEPAKKDGGDKKAKAAAAPKKQKAAK